MENMKSSYMNDNSVYGLAVEVEHLWSICKYILTNLRFHLSHILFESLFYLTMNAEYWDIKILQDEYANVLMET